MMWCDVADPIQSGTVMLMKGAWRYCWRTARETIEVKDAEALWWTSIQALESLLRQHVRVELQLDFACLDGVPEWLKSLASHQ